jgi:transposase
MSSHSTSGAASTAAAAHSGADDDVDTITPVGVDVGTKQLVAVATASATVDEAIVVDGERARRVHAAFTEATHRLQERAVAETLGDVVWRHWRRLRREFQAAAEAVLAVAQRHARPVVVLEDLPQRRQPLVACRHGNLRAPTWIPPAVQAIVADHVVDAGVPVTYVSPEFTSQNCHQCRQPGKLSDNTVRCTTDDCPVERVDRDRSAAVSIAKRV